MTDKQIAKLFNDLHALNMITNSKLTEINEDIDNLSNAIANVVIELNRLQKERESPKEKEGEIEHTWAGDIFYPNRGLGQPVIVRCPYCKKQHEIKI